MNTGRFERDFIAALWADAPEQHALAAQPGFAIYRNTVRKGCIDALEANFPAVVRLVGRDWFRAAAARHASAAPPDDARLLHYGRAFPAFLAGFAPAAGLPWLPAVAMLDRLWTESHAAADAPVLSPAALARIAPEDLQALHLPPHPAARWHWFDGAPIHGIWSANRSGDAQALAALPDLPWRGEGTLLLRPTQAVTWQPLDAAGCAFLDACRRGATLGDAAVDVLGRHPDADVAALLALLLQAGAFTTPNPHATP